MVGEALFYVVCECGVALSPSLFVDAPNGEIRLARSVRDAGLPGGLDPGVGRLAEAMDISLAPRLR